MGSNIYVNQTYHGTIEAHDTTIGANFTVFNSKHVPPLAEIHQYIQSLVDDNEDNSTKARAVEKLISIAVNTQRGASDIAREMLDANAMPKIVSYLNSDSDELAQGTIGILAWVLRYPKTWDVTLRTNIIPLLVERLFDSSIQTKIDAACALAHITGTDIAKRRAVESGAVPPLVSFLEDISVKLRQMAARAVRNISSIDIGRKAVYQSNATPALVAALDSASTDRVLQLDVVKALSALASMGKAGKSTIKRYGAIVKLKNYFGAPKELEEAVWELQDKLRP